MSELKKMVAIFYNECLTVNEKTNTNEVLEKLLADDFQSINAKETKGKAQLIDLDGLKSFKTMSMDMHTIENGQLKTVYHIEEWTTAIAQLKS